jgi:alkylhydroperoxidase/carboxymuconolactone decarboxylase family protein YurZ
MSDKGVPKWYATLEKRHPKFMNAVQDLGKAVKQAGPLDEKTAHLVQLAAAAALRSEGGVHSHAKRAMQAGAKSEEIFHAVILLTSTIGFPTVSAALSWVADVTDKK